MNRFLAALIAIPALTASATLFAADPAETARINAIVVACERLEHDYAIYRDRGEAEAFANIFTEDGEWGRPTTILKGRDAIRDYIESSSDHPPEVHMQFTTTIQITPVDETTATGISYAMVLEAPISDDGLPVTLAAFQVASESRSVYKLTDDGWKISRLELKSIVRGPGIA